MTGSSIPPVLLPDPLTNLSDSDLGDSLLTLHLICGRNRSTLKAKHRERACYLAELLTLEQTKRGISTAPPPYHA